jgi:capsular exopolysaccharide synthesis family protein
MDDTSLNSATQLEKLDILSFVNEFLHRLRRLWWIIVLTVAIAMGLSYFRSSSNYSPSYVAEATVSVEMVNGGAAAKRSTAEQMGKIFPYIMTSGALSDVIASDLNMNSVPGSIKVSNISGTSLLTIRVTSWNANYAYDVLQSVLKNYPEIAQFVVGQTELQLIDDSGIPTDTGRSSVIRGSLRRGAVIGLGIGIVLILLHVATFRTIRTETELRNLLNVPCLGTLPFSVTKKRRKKASRQINILYDSYRSDYIEAMRLVRTRLERQLEGKQVLMVTSSVSGEGKSTVAANLAVSMALKGKRVILVDCDLRNPSVAEFFNLKQEFPGLINVLNGKAALADALYSVSFRGKPIGLTLLPGGNRESSLVEILGSEAMSELIGLLRQQADIVILDTPPSAVLVDAMMLVRHVDAVAYVIMSDFARRRYIIQGVEELSNSDAPIVGCILNGGSTHSGGYYGYKYGYGYRYGYGSRYSSSRYSGSRQKSSRSKSSRSDRSRSEGERSTAGRPEGDKAPEQSGNA